MISRMALGVRSRIATSVRTKLVQLQDRVSAKFTLPDKYKDTIVEKWSRYWTQLFIDYGEVFVGVGQTVRKQPIKATAYASVGAGIYYSAITNPTLTDFMIQLRRNTADIVQVSEHCQKPDASEYLRFLERGLNTGVIRHMDLGVASLLWLADYDEALALYKATCPYLDVEYLSFSDRVIDVGFAGTWWNMHKKMVDFDVVE